MRLTHLLAPSHGLARAGRAWLLGLALALVAAHSLAVWHAYTHGIAEPAGRSTDKQNVASDACGLCIAAADIGGAAAPPPPLHLHRFAQPAPLPMRAAAPQQAPQRQPYAIRAPPVLAA